MTQLTRTREVEFWLTDWRALQYRRDALIRRSSGVLPESHALVSCKADAIGSLEGDDPPLCVRRAVLYAWPKCCENALTYRDNTRCLGGEAVGRRYVVIVSAAWRCESSGTFRRSPEQKVSRAHRGLHGTRVEHLFGFICARPQQRREPLCRSCVLAFARVMINVQRG